MDALYDFGRYEMNKKDLLTNLFIENDLIRDEDTYTHKFYTIITRPGIEKIQANNNITISFEAVEMQANFAVVKAIATKGDVRIETFGSALHGTTGKNATGNTTTWYVAEIAEKRAMSRAVLKIAGFYEHGCFGEDEAEDFKKSKPTYSQTESKKVVRLKKELDAAFAKNDFIEAQSIYDEAEADDLKQVCDYYESLLRQNDKEGM